MRPAHPTTWFPALALAFLALGAAQPLAAQNDSGLSSGSGVGTGSGASSRVDRPPGEEAVIESPGGVRGSPLIPPGARSDGVPLGPGVNVRFPDDPSLAPFLSLEEAAIENAQSRARIRQDMLDVANQLEAPGERGRVLLQIGRGAILGGQIRLAHQAVEDAANAAFLEKNDLIHDQLIISIVTTAGLLSETLLREAKPQTLLFEEFAEGALTPGRLQPEVAIQLARLEWRRSAYMASLIRNPTYRSEYLERSVANMASGSATIALEYAAATSAAGAKGAPTDEQIAEFKKQADEILAEALSFANQIERPIWKNRAMEGIATSAGQSDQNDRAVEIAGGIRNAEARARALVLVAEFQARRNQNDAATRSYNDAAEAVASIPDHGLRGVLSGILVDSLISTGRFEDARACVTLYPTDSEKFVAMGAIAESLGARRMNDMAREWIDRDVPPEYRSTLYRRLSNGMLRAITEERAKDLQGEGF